MKGTVFFETITGIHRPLVDWYLRWGYQVHVFDFNYRLKFLDWLRPLLLNGRIQRIYLHPTSAAEGWAIDAAAWLYPQARNHPLIQQLGDLYGQEEVHSGFQYALVSSLVPYFYARLYLDRHLRNHPGERVIFIPDTYMTTDRLLGAWCRGRMGSLDGLSIAKVSGTLLSWAGKCDRGFRRFFSCLAWGGYAILSGLIRRMRKALPQETSFVTYAYSIETRFQAKYTGGRRFDFLLDGERLTRENTAFVVGPLAEGSWMAQARREGYRIIRRADYYGLRNLLRNPPHTTDTGKILRALWQGIRCFQDSPWLHEAALTGIACYLKDKGLLDRFQFRHLLYMNQYGLVPRWRNALLRKHGAQSWFVAHSNGGAFLYQEGQEFAEGKDFGGCYRFWAHENADHFVSPCRDLIEYQRRHPQRFRQYHNVGNIWSDQILRAESKMDRSAVRRGWFSSIGEKQKIIAWFDTSFVEAPNSPSTFQEAIQWYRDILRLAEEDADLFMVLKPSKEEAYYVGEGPDQQWSYPPVGRKLLEVWEACRRHPRIRFLQHQEDPGVIIAASDLTVTFCFSSVSAEALGARKKGIWYEPADRWRQTHYGRHPLLVAHGYEQLRSLVRRFLFEMSEADYQEHLEGTVRGLVEEFLDGNGLSRLRSLLTSVGAVEEAPLQSEAAFIR